MHAHTDVKTVNPPQTKFAGGITTAESQVKPSVATAAVCSKVVILLVLVIFSLLLQLYVKSFVLNFVSSWAL